MITQAVWQRLRRSGTFATPAPRVWLAVLCLLLLVPSIATAADEPGTDVTQAGTLAESAQLTRDRELQSLLSSAESSIHREDYAVAVAHLIEVLERADAAFVSHQSRDVSAAELANRLLGSLPEAARDLYEQQVGGRAEQMLLAAASAGDFDAVRLVAKRHHHTSAGCEALLTLAAHHFDNGRVSLAAAAFDAVSRHRRCKPPARQAATVRFITCHALLGNRDRARRLLDEHRNQIDAAGLTVAGERVDARDWLNALLDSSPSQPAEGDFSHQAHQPQAALVATGAASRPMELPGLTPTWSRDSGMVEAVGELIEEALDELSYYSISRLDGYRPLVIGDRIFARNMDSITAFDGHTGRVLWQQAVDSPSARLAKNLKRLENDGFRRMTAERLVRQIQADRSGGSLTSDGTRLFAVASDPGETELVSYSANRPGFRFRMRARFSSSAQRLRENRLFAMDLDTGAMLWRTGPQTDEKHPMAGGLGEASILSPPLAVDGMLYVVAMENEDIKLAALAPQDGHVQWRLPLASATGLSAESTLPPGSSCPLVMHDGSLICPTGAGALVAVDLLTRSPRWAFRYRRDDRPIESGLLPGLDARPSPPWWLGWRFPSAMAVDGKLVFAGGESQAVHVLDIATGKLLWSQSHRDGLFVAGASEQRLIVVGRQSIGAFDLTTGEPLWTTPIATPSGCGVFTASGYVLPLADGSLATIPLSDGSLRRQFRGDDAPLGNLAVHGRSLISQNYDRLAKFEPLTGELDRAGERLTAHPDSQDAQVAKALLDRAAGNYQDAAATLRPLLETHGEARRHLRDTLLSELREFPERVDEIAKQLKPLVEGDAERSDCLSAVAEAYRQTGRPREALSVYRDLLEAATGDHADDSDELIVEHTGRNVAARRLIQGKMVDVLENLSSVEQRAFQHDLDERRKRALADPDPFAIQDFYAGYGPLFDDETLTRGMATISKQPQSTLEGQLQLLALANRAHRGIAAAATRELAEFMQVHRYQRDAWAYRRRLEGELLADTDHSPSGSSGKESRTGHGADRALAAADPWPEAAPTITVENPIRIDNETSLINVAAQPGSLLDRLSVSMNTVEREDQRVELVRFQGDRQRGAWDVELPAMEGSFRTLDMLREGWGIGHLLILKVGTDLFGIAPYDQNGEANAKVLWHVATKAESSFAMNNMPLRLAPARIGFGAIGISAVDRFGHPLGEVGPVNAGYLCYRDRGTLVALDPLSGRQLWRRFGLPTNAVCSGDDEFVIIRDPESNAVEVLRALDGKSLSTRTLPLEPNDELLVQKGRRALVQNISGGAALLETRDLVDGSVVWKREFSAAAVAFLIDDDCFGVLEMDGGMSVIRWRDGRTASSQQLDIPDPLTRVFTIVDEQRLYLALSGPFRNEANVRANRQQFGLRNAPIDGMLYAFDRYTGKLDWQSRMEDVLLPLDQPKEAPLLILNYTDTRRADTEWETRLDVVRCLDKRTGKLLYEHESTATEDGPVYQLETDFDQKQIDLRLHDQRIRFRYAD